MQGYASGDIQTFYIYFSQIGHGPYKNVLVGNSDYFICHFIVIGIYRGRYIGQKCADRFTLRNAYIILPGAFRTQISRSYPAVIQIVEIG